MRLVFGKFVQLIVCCSALFAFSATGQSVSEEDNFVLVIDSYHTGVAQSEQFLAGLHNGLSAASDLFPELRTISLDSNHYSSEVTSPLLLQEINQKNLANPAVIVLNGIPAFEFFQRHRDTLFAGTPAILAGVFAGQIDEQQVRQDALLTGVISLDPLARTIELAAKLHPDSSHMLVVGDGSAQVALEQQRTASAEALLARPLHVEFLSQWDVRQLPRHTSGLDELGVIVSTSAGGRNQVSRLSPAAMLTLLNIGDHPVYTTDVRLVEQGAVGGYAESAEPRGRLVAGYIKRIMRGTAPSELPYLNDQASHAVFNKLAMDRFGIELHQIPQSAEIKQADAPLSTLLYLSLLPALAVLAWLAYFFLFRPGSSILHRNSLSGMDEAMLLRMLLNSNPDLIYAKNRRGQYIECNQAFVNFTGRTYSSTVGEMVGRVFADTPVEMIVEQDQEVYKKEKTLCRETWLHNGEGEPFLFESVKTPLRNSRGEIVGLLGIDRDITGRYYENALLKQSNRILDMIIRGVALPAILLEVTRSFEKVCPDSRCSVLLIDREKRRLMHGAAPSLPDFYNEAINGLEFGVGVGSCGTAAATGKQVIVDDVNSHPYWAPYVELAHKANIGAVWSHPVIGSSGAVVAIFTIYHETPRSPNSDDLSRMEQAGRLVSLALERKQVEGDLQKLSRAVEQSPTMVLITDAHGTIEYVNEEFTEVTGYSLDEVRGLTPAVLNAGEMEGDFYKDMWKTIKAGHDWHGEIRNKTKSGQPYWSMLSISPILDESGNITHYIGVSEDISAQKKTQEQIEQLAFYDPLTRLGNRRLFREQLESELKKAARRDTLFALFYLDLDNFKQVNDTLGHDVGDRLLQTVADRLRYVLRNSDFIARLGGDEFIALLPDVSGPKEAQVVADKLLKALCQPIYLGNTEVDVTVSLGITLAPLDGDDWSVLMKNADLAMYRAKHEGRNNYQFFTPEMNEEVLHRVEMEQQLRRALENDEFCLHYQPQWNILSELQPVCLEALVRWEHPKRGRIPPSEFIPMAEELGLIVELGDWILQQACADGQRLLRGGHNISVAVNLSMRQFFDPQLLVKVDNALKQSGFPAANLELEITESMLMDDVELVRSTLDRLKELGVSLAIDDFGTGYSSLGYLKALPFDQLKVDASFVRDIPHDKNDMEITAAVVAMAHKLGLKVVAEGIETQEQLAFLRENRCEMGQGYLLARPAPFDEVLSLLDVEFDSDIG
ncbi:ABC transporter substrate binding protein [Neptunomonas marina]|uniref:cyclic-guanylate-specific phosphodiesterase n=1 Tax=Neptunomonas marina TaxID=1815562 RepID=A0A437QAH1_9GAMM|nr:ABC transporter substrate binding protein [Neptunomonas marina]RVU31399.1 EAL domain-containing protein [Neptunomonas marina]